MLILPRLIVKVKQKDLMRNRSLKKTTKTNQIKLARLAYQRFAKDHLILNQALVKLNMFPVITLSCKCPLRRRKNAWIMVFIFLFLDWMRMATNAVSLCMKIKISASLQSSLKICRIHKNKIQSQRTALNMFVIICIQSDAYVQTEEF